MDMVWLASGVTGVVDIGGPFWNFEMREIALKTAAAPRVAVAGPLISMIADPKLDLGDPPIIEVTSADAARNLVRRELAHKPDYVKVWFIHRAGDDLAAQEAIVRAAGDEAHRAGVPLAVHATELNVAKAALRAGADYLVHSIGDVPVDEEFIALASCIAPRCSSSLATNTRCPTPGSRPRRNCVSPIGKSSRRCETWLTCRRRSFHRTSHSASRSTLRSSHRRLRCEICAPSRTQASPS